MSIYFQDAQISVNTAESGRKIPVYLKDAKIAVNAAAPSGENQKQQRGSIADRPSGPSGAAGGNRPPQTPQPPASPTRSLLSVPNYFQSN